MRPRSSYRRGARTFFLLLVLGIALSDAGATAISSDPDASTTQRCPGYEDVDRPQFVGTPGADVFRGGPEPEVFCGFGGRDRIFGGGKFDRIYGGIGRDRLVGGDGNDLLDGGGGFDRLFGGPGSDFCVHTRVRPLDRVRYCEAVD